MSILSRIRATIHWQRAGALFSDNLYSRGHRWEFDGGVTVQASSSPHVVPVPMSVSEAVDPEEAFVASLSSCHMLWFLSLAAKRGFVVEDYRDDADGLLAKNTSGQMAMTEVTLRPAVSFAGELQPTPDEFLALHRETHEKCYIANSVRTDVRCVPVITGQSNR
jgi:organic hydroperoxide reductase OsmC/OhrA